VQPSRNVAGPQLAHIVTAVDGSVVKTLSTIAVAAYLKNIHGHAKSAT
jgi:hypothetical protein